MKFNCPKFKSAEERRKDKEQWHKWFAWYPIRVIDGSCRWLEIVHRSGYSYTGYRGTRFWIYTYR